MFLLYRDPQGSCPESFRRVTHPDKMFLPSPGKLLELRLPEPGSHVRVDTGVRQGDAITAWYDPMIAKLICWGQTREEALTNMAAALAATRIDGISNNINFLRRVMEHAAFARGDVFTGFLETYRQDLVG